MIMNYLKYRLLFLILFARNSILFSQEESLLLLFPKQVQWINPSMTAAYGDSSLGFQLNSQWLGVKDAPKQQTIYYESNSGLKKINWGGVIRNRSRFSENSLQFFLQSSIPIQLATDVLLHLGLQAGGDFFQLNFDYLRSVDGVQIDPLLQKQSHYIPNLGTGIHVQHKNYSLQFSLPRLLERYSLKKTPEIFLPDRLYFFSSFQWEQTNYSAYSFLTLELQCHNLGWNPLNIQLKGSYHSTLGTIFMGINSSKNIGFGFQLDAKQVLTLGYAFQFPLFANSDLKLNNHSINLRFHLKNSAKNKPIL